MKNKIKYNCTPVATAIEIFCNKKKYWIFSIIYFIIFMNFLNRCTHCYNNVLQNFTPNSNVYYNDSVSKNYYQFSIPLMNTEMNFLFSFPIYLSQVWKKSITSRMSINNSYYWLNLRKYWTKYFYNIKFTLTN